MTNKDYNAFAAQLPIDSAYKNQRKYDGLSAAEYAAIHLKVPKSGTPWLDEMIEEANRRDSVIIQNKPTFINNANDDKNNERAYYGEFA